MDYSAEIPLDEDSVDSMMTGIEHVDLRSRPPKPAQIMSAQHKSVPKLKLAPILQARALSAQHQAPQQPTGATKFFCDDDFEETFGDSATFSQGSRGEPGPAGSRGGPEETSLQGLSETSTFRPMGTPAGELLRPMSVGTPAGEFFEGNSSDSPEPGTRQSPVVVDPNWQVDNVSDKILHQRPCTFDYAVERARPLVENFVRNTVEAAEFEASREKERAGVEKVVREYVSEKVEEGKRSALVKLVRGAAEEAFGVGGGGDFAGEEEVGGGTAEAVGGGEGAAEEAIGVGGGGNGAGEGVGGEVSVRQSEEAVGGGGDESPRQKEEAGEERGAGAPRLDDGAGAAKTTEHESAAPADAADKKTQGRYLSAGAPTKPESKGVKRPSSGKAKPKTSSPRYPDEGIPEGEGILSDRDPSGRSSGPSTLDVEQASTAARGVDMLAEEDAKRLKSGSEEEAVPFREDGRPPEPPPQKKSPKSSRPRKASSPRTSPKLLVGTGPAASSSGPKLLVGTGPTGPAASSSMGRGPMIPKHPPVPILKFKTSPTLCDEEKRRAEFLSGRRSGDSREPSPILELLSAIDPLRSEEVVRPSTPPPPKEVVTRRQALETLKNYLMTPPRKFFRGSVGREEAIPAFFNHELMAGLSEHEQLRLFMEAEKVGLCGLCVYVERHLRGAEWSFVTCGREGSR